jgi:hypothetical protein
MYPYIAMLSMLTVGQRNGTNLRSIAIWAMGMELTELTIEVHFVPLPPQECEEHTRRLHALLLKGALRLAAQEEVAECAAAPKVGQ